MCSTCSTDHIHKKFNLMAFNAKKTLACFDGVLINNLGCQLLYVFVVQ